MASRPCEVVIECLGCKVSISPDDAGYSQIASMCCSEQCVVWALNELRQVKQALDSEGKHPAAPHEGVWSWISRAIQAEERVDELTDLYSTAALARSDT